MEQEQWIKVRITKGERDPPHLENKHPKQAKRRVSRGGDAFLPSFPTLGSKACSPSPAPASNRRHVCSSGAGNLAWRPEEQDQRLGTTGTRPGSREKCGNRAGERIVFPSRSSGSHPGPSAFPLTTVPSSKSAGPSAYSKPISLFLHPRPALHHLPAGAQPAKWSPGLPPFLLKIHSPWSGDLLKSYCGTPVALPSTTRSVWPGSRSSPLTFHVTTCGPSHSSTHTGLSVLCTYDHILASRPFLFPLSAGLLSPRRLPWLSRPPAPSPSSV